ncbi:unnamed protein product, partial [Soboliphyme baturini]|uniref:Suf domain-containing protein n=1 Tax=Soboliphyme baturini TaxID=241478 RepID=A0A183IVH4_9BILA
FFFSSSEVWDRYLEFESLVGDLATILKVNKRRQLAHVLRSGTEPVGNSPEKTSKYRHYDYGDGYPRPNLHQLIPFKPKIITTSSYHPVPGGVFPPPPAVAHFMSLMPPPYSFNGPFVIVDLLIEKFTDMSLGDELPRPNTEPDAVENSDFSNEIKKDFYQLLSTTPDPTQVSNCLAYLSAARAYGSKIEVTVCSCRGQILFSVCHCANLTYVIILCIFMPHTPDEKFSLLNNALCDLYFMLKSENSSAIS